MLNLVQDMLLSLLQKLGLEAAHVVGHDFGSPVAAYLSLTRPELLRSCVLMSAPFGGVPIGGRAGNVHEDLAKLGRKHYQWYYSTREADERHAPRAAGDARVPARLLPLQERRLERNQPFRLKAWKAAELAKMPTYYVMDLDKGMAETVAPYMPRRRIAANNWMTDAELRVYANDFEHTGFQGGLNWYRCMTQPAVHRRAQRRSRERRSTCRRCSSPAPRLGRVPEARRARAHAGERVHRFPRRAPRRRRRALGAAGAARTHGRAADRFPSSGTEPESRSGSVPN